MAGDGEKAIRAANNAIEKAEKFNTWYHNLKWNVWYWTLVIIIPICFFLVAYDGIRLLFNLVPPKDYQGAIENVAIRGAALVVLTPIWYFLMYRPRHREKNKNQGV